jgi:acetyltransferase-like isoleucine patch superfamily enzyme
MWQKCDCFCTSTYRPHPHLLHSVGMCSVASHWTTTGCQGHAINEGVPHCHAIACAPVQVGDDSALGMSVLIASFSVDPGSPGQSPADKDGPSQQQTPQQGDNNNSTCGPMLILEDAHVGQGCDVGPQAVLPCGCCLADGTVVVAGEVLHQQACAWPPAPSSSLSSPPGEALGGKSSAGTSSFKGSQQEQDPWQQAERPFYAERFMSRGAVAGLLGSSLLLEVLLAYPGTFFLYWVLQVGGLGREGGRGVLCPTSGSLEGSLGRGQGPGPRGKALKRWVALYHPWLYCGKHVVPASLHYPPPP